MVVGQRKTINEYNFDLIKITFAFIKGKILLMLIHACIFSTFNQSILLLKLFSLT